MRSVPSWLACAPRAGGSFVIVITIDGLMLVCAHHATSEGDESRRAHLHARTEAAPVGEAPPAQQRRLPLCRPAASAGSPPAPGGSLAAARPPVSAGSRRPAARLRPPRSSPSRLLPRQARRLVRQVPSRCFLNYYCRSAAARGLLALPQRVALLRTTLLSASLEPTLHSVLRWMMAPPGLRLLRGGSLLIMHRSPAGSWH